MRNLQGLFCIALPGHLDFISFLGCAIFFFAGDWPQTTIPNERAQKLSYGLEFWALSLGIVVWGQSPAKNNMAQPRKDMKSRCPGKAIQKRVFTVLNEFSLDWLCVARLTRLLL